jgi:hypothetical protein
MNKKICDARNRSKIIKKNIFAISTINRYKIKRIKQAKKVGFQTTLILFEVLIIIENHILKDDAYI